MGPFRVVLHHHNGMPGSLGFPWPVLHRSGAPVSPAIFGIYKWVFSVAWANAFSWSFLRPRAGGGGGLCHWRGVVMFILLWLKY